MLYRGYGILGGLGLGVGYITPVSTVLSGFLISVDLRLLPLWALALAVNQSHCPICNFQARGVEQTFYILGVVYFIVMLLSHNSLNILRVEEAQLLATGGQTKQAPLI